MALGMKVVCNDEGNGNSNEGNGNKGGGQATAMRAMGTMWAMVTVTVMRLASNKEGKGEGGKSNDNGDVRVTGKEDEEGSRVMVLVTRMAGDWTATATKRAIATATWVAGKRRQLQQRGR
jgi:hypothetical protein